jgi:hypothetical protein
MKLNLNYYRTHPALRVRLCCVKIPLMDNENGSSSDPRYDHCVNGFPGWRVFVGDDDHRDTEVLSPAGISFTSAELYLDELKDQGYSKSYIEQYAKDGPTATVIWDCLARGIIEE